MEYGYGVGLEGRSYEMRRGMEERVTLSWGWSFLM
jgi:hypothetical protein